jgi:hypothetical protein
MDVSKLIFCVWMALITVPTAASAQPWSEVRIGNVADKGKGEHDLMMIAINGSRDVPDALVYELAPGPQSLSLASKKRNETGAIIALPYTIDMAPCVRYELIADYANPPPNRDWKIAVKAQIPIKSCLKKHGDSLPAPAQAVDTPDATAAIGTDSAGAPGLASSWLQGTP